MGFPVCIRRRHSQRGYRVTRADPPLGRIHGKRHTLKIDIFRSISSRLTRAFMVESLLVCPHWRARAVRSSSLVQSLPRCPRHAATLGQGPPSPFTLTYFFCFSRAPGRGVTNGLFITPRAARVVASTATCAKASLQPVNSQSTSQCAHGLLCGSISPPSPPGYTARRGRDGRCGNRPLDSPCLVAKTVPGKIYPEECWLGSGDRTPCDDGEEVWRRQ